MAARVCMDVRVGAEAAEAGRVVVALHEDDLPQFSENFRALCTGETAEGRTYAGTCLMNVEAVDGVAVLHFGHLVHREDAMAASLDMHIVDGDDDGDADEPMGSCAFATDGDPSTRLFANREEAAASQNHTESGLVSMEPHARDPATKDFLYGSRFAITLGRCPSRDGRGVVVGRVLFGFGMLRELEALKLGSRNQPLQHVSIVASDELVHAHEDGTLVQPDGDPFQRWPADHPQMGNHQYTNRAAAALQIKAFGNEAFGKGDYARAVEKYEKALRYLTKRFTAGMLELPDEVSERHVQVSARCPIFLNLSLCHVKLAEAKAKAGDASGAASCWRRAVESADACEAAVAAYAHDRDHAPGMGLMKRADIEARAYSLDRGQQLKLYQRRGRAHAGLRQWESAVADLGRACALDPANAATARELEVARRAMAKKRAKTQARFGAAFGDGLYDEPDAADAPSSGAVYGAKACERMARAREAADAATAAAAAAAQKPATAAGPVDGDDADSAARAESLAARLAAFLDSGGGSAP